MGHDDFAPLRPEVTAHWLTNGSEGLGFAERQCQPADNRKGKRTRFIRDKKERNELETTQTRKRRFPVTLVVILLLLAAGVVLVNLFSQSLVTAEQKHDHDGDGKADH